MATISSHVLDSVLGTHASGIRCQLYRHYPDAPPELVFDVKADQEGRICEEVDVDQATRAAEYELVLDKGAYFEMQSSGFNNMVDVIVIRFAITDRHRRYHLPVMLSPHSYSAWWSD